MCFAVCTPNSRPRRKLIIIIIIIIYHLEHYLKTYFNKISYCLCDTKVWFSCLFVNSFQILTGRFLPDAAVWSAVFVVLVGQIAVTFRPSARSLLHRKRSRWPGLRSTNTASVTDQLLCVVFVKVNVWGLSANMMPRLAAILGERVIVCTARSQQIERFTSVSGWSFGPVLHPDWSSEQKWAVDT